MVDESGLPPGLFFKLAQVSQLTCRGRTGLYEDIKTGRLKTVMAGRSRLVSREHLLDYARLIEEGGLVDDD